MYYFGCNIKKITLNLTFLTDISVKEIVFSCNMTQNICFFLKMIYSDIKSTSFLLLESYHIARFPCYFFSQCFLKDKTMENFMIGES